MGPQGLYLNKWTPEFDPAQDVPLVVPVWVCLPHLPLHCWSPKTLKTIGNTLGKYIDRADRKGKYSCDRICVEVDLEVGLLEAIKLTMEKWSHVQELDYKQLPFKCWNCHGYGHFARNCKNKTEEETEKMKRDQWTTVQKTASSKQNNKPRGKGAQAGTSVPSTKLQPEGAAPPRTELPSNSSQLSAHRKKPWLRKVMQNNRQTPH